MRSGLDKKVVLQCQAPEEEEGPEQAMSYAKQVDYESYILFTREKNETESAKHHHTTGQSQQEADQAVLHNGNMGHQKCVIATECLSALGLINSCLFRRKSQVHWNSNFSTFESYRPDCSKITPEQGYKTRLPLFFHQDL